MAGLVARRRSRIFQGHDWVFASEVERRFGEMKEGDVVELRSGRDRFLGSAVYDPNSKIVARRFSKQKQNLDADFFGRRIKRACLWRMEKGLYKSGGRLIHGEADGLPGVFVDLFDEVAVMKIESPGMACYRKLIIEALLSETDIKEVTEWNDVNEELKTTNLERPYFACVGELFCSTSDLEGKSILVLNGTNKNWEDHFSTIGASQVTHLSGDEFLKIDTEGGEVFDVIILLPMDFSSVKGGLKQEVRLFKKMHCSIFKSVSRGGLLVSFNTNSELDRSVFEEVIRDASVEASRGMKVLELLRPSADFPVISTLPESELFKGVLLESLAGW